MSPNLTPEPSEKIESISCRMTPTLRQSLRMLAAEAGVDIGDVVAEAIHTYYARQLKQHAKKFAQRDRKNVQLEATNDAEGLAS